MPIAHPFHKLMASLVPVILIALVTGCTSPDASNQIKAFSDATILMANNTSQAFQMVEDNHFNEEVSKTVLNYDKDVGFRPNDIQPFIGTNALQLRLEVLAGLKSYAANLSALMGNSSLSNFDQGTTQLGQALATFDTNLVKSSLLEKEPATSQEIQIFTTAINTLGHWLIARKQEREAKQAIESMQQPLTNICALLQKDFSILHNQLTNDYTTILKNKDDYILHNLAHFDATPHEKSLEILELAQLKRQMESDSEVLSSLESAVAKLAAAHTALQNVFLKNNEDIKSLIGELSTEAQRISKYYNSAKPTN